MSYNDCSQPSYTVKQILLENGNWWRFFQFNRNRIRRGIVRAITKLLSCRTKFMGYAKYKCSNKDCDHTVIVPFTCKSKACSSCGKKQTEIWINKQHNILPKTEWQHITFTMPDKLWVLFWFNRDLLNSVTKLAANTILSFANSKGLTVGIFTALHTFGHDLKRNVHVHLSTTRTGLTSALTELKHIFYPYAKIMLSWKRGLLSLLSKLYSSNDLVLPKSLQRELNPAHTFDDFLSHLASLNWWVNFSKPQTSHYHNVNYLGRYVKRPAIANSRLMHYDGNHVVFDYLDRKTNKKKVMSFSVSHFIERFVWHIPDTNFKMIRYYGFLANRVRGKLLPIVNNLLGNARTFVSKTISFIDLLKINYNRNFLKCSFCGGNLELSRRYFGLFGSEFIHTIHQRLATSAFQNK